jgi:glyoxylase-like metal-dependent hydrolase (beta-lactamase superfamily II)
MPDTNLTLVALQIRSLRDTAASKPVVHCFFDEATNTASYVVHDPAARRAAIIDSVLDYDSAAGRTSTASADRIIEFITRHGLDVDWILETHAHADHLSAAPYLQQQLGGKVAIGREIIRVQHVFGKLFNAGTDFARDGSEFDRLFQDGDQFSIGDIPAVALHVPGHTPADMAYVVGDAVFTGDTLFMPDYGTARADFPGGDARQLYRSIRRLLSLPDETRLFLCHDYKAPGRNEYAWETSVRAERKGNVHVHEGVGEDEFVEMRMRRDASLAMPKLILPSIQVNMRAGHPPAPEENGTRYLKIPLDALPMSSTRGATVSREMPTQKD